MKSNNDTIEKKLFLNKPQLLVYLIKAFITVLIWGRGTGKSSGAISLHLVDLVHKMPRGKTLLVCPTYIHALTNTLPPVIEMWTKLGYVKDVDYFVGRKPPAKFGDWDEPYAPPLSYKNTIYWYTGHVIVLVSQDRIQNAAGISGDAMVIDEAKHINYEKLKETFQTLRGNKSYFQHLSCYRSIFIATDMPTSSKSKWIFDYEQYMDNELIELIKGINFEILKLKKQLKKASKTKSDKLHKQIKAYEKDLNYLRKGDIDNNINPAVLFSEFSALENMEVLGEEYIREQKRTLTPAKFRASILNERITKIEGGFYPALQDEIHYYFSFNNSILNNNIDKDLKLKPSGYEYDGDVLGDDPLYIGMDYNNKINSLSVGQPGKKVFKTLNFFFVEPPKLLPDVVQKFCDYYANHPNRTVIYYYDHTAIYKDASRDYSFADEVIATLKQNKWTVITEYIGQAYSHQKKYFLIALGMSNKRGLPFPKFNQHNCQSLITSMENADARSGRNGFEKDKKSERDVNIPPNESTHPSDSWDTLYVSYSKNMVDIDDDSVFDIEVI